MIGFFTDPYPDELLYSACSRYHRRARNISKEATARDLFGNARTKIVIDFQTRLDYLAAQLPLTTYSVSRLIDEYTMLPLYAPFLPAERLEVLRRDMSGGGGNSVHARIGILSYGLDVKRLRFCPVCIEEDREPYWHRTHQVSGVEVCPIHFVFLSDSEVSVRNRSSGRAFMTARQAIDEMPRSVRAVRPLDPDNREHQALLCLAKDAAWVLSARINVPYQSGLRRKYLRLLLERGLATYGGKVRHTPLNEQLLNHYTPALLERLRCGLHGQYHWLRHLANNWTIAHHPLHHLLLMQFLKCSAKEFFRLPAEIEPFGKGPWPCLNPAGGHYREARIKKCMIKQIRDDSKTLAGTFLCECGFSYRRIGSDATDERQYHYDMVMSFGVAWYEELRRMKENGTHSRKEMAQELRVSVDTIKSQLKRLKASSESGVPPTQRKKMGRPRLPVSDSDRRSKHRRMWRETVAENLEASRTELRRAAPKAYNWLAVHDKKWLDENSPEWRLSHRKIPQVDWSERDQNYSASVCETSRKMLTAPGRPVRASRTAISKHIGILAVVTKSGGKLPLTNKALDEVSESATAFAIRRICWAANCYRQELVPAAGWQLLSRAAISNKMARHLEIKAACQEYVRVLHEMKEAGWKVPQKAICAKPQRLSNIRLNISACSTASSNALCVCGDSPLN